MQFWRMLDLYYRNDLPVARRHESFVLSTGELERIGEDILTACRKKIRSFGALPFRPYIDNL